MNDKKTDLKRVTIFVLLACGLYFIPAFICRGAGVLRSEAGMGLITFLAMFTPAAASLITRYITKEGMERSYLRMRLKGNIPLYIAAIAAPLLYTAAEALMSFLYTGENHTSEMLANMDITLSGYTANAVANAAACLCLFPVFLGEELGWRGYLYPKLKELCGKPLAYLIGGVIWGVWHTPAIVDGLNFGKDYSGYPYLGILYMCAFCIPAGMLFDMITEKTGTVYPAAFAHSINNNVCPFIHILVFGTGKMTAEPAAVIISAVSVLLTAAVMAVFIKFYPKKMPAEEG